MKDTDIHLARSSQLIRPDYNTRLFSQVAHMIDWNNANYQQQLDAKLVWLRRLLAPFTDQEPEVFPSPEHSYRMRTEFRVWHQGDEISYAMYEPGSNKTYSITDFPPASSAIREMMPRLIKHIGKNELLRKRLFRIEFLSTTGAELLVSLIYHKPIDEIWELQAHEMADNLSLQIIGRSKKKKIVIGQDFVTEKLKVRDNTYLMRQIEGTFTQPNAVVNEKMVNWACDQAKDINGDLLELYCGNGNFTLPLSRQFTKVLTTEISKGSIAALKWNLEANEVKNIELARLSAEETTEALDRVRPFRRLSHINLDDYQFSTIFVDPPRAGVDPKTMELVRRFDQILYISCNPETLAENIKQISDTHRIKTIAAFDQFPFTPHLEAGVCLEPIAV